MKIPQTKFLLLNHHQTLNNKSCQLPKLKPNLNIKYKVYQNSDWEVGTISSSAGKSTGKFSKVWNVEDINGEKKYVDFSRISHWEPISDQQQ